MFLENQKSALEADPYARQPNVYRLEIDLRHEKELYISNQSCTIPKEWLKKKAATNFEKRSIEDR